MWGPLAVVALYLPVQFVPPNGPAVLSGGEASVTTLSERDASLALHSAIRAGDMARVNQLLRTGVSVNILDELGGTPLLTACWSGHAEIVSLLISRGADVNARHREAGSSALEYAVLTVRPDIVAPLLRAGADVSVKYEGGQTALHLAAERVSPAVIDLLLGAKADREALNNAGNTPLEEAVLHDRLESLRTLIDHGASFRTAHRADGRSALHEACIKGFRGIAELLLQKGADPALRDSSGQSPLDLALAYKNASVVSLLLSLGKSSISGSQAAADRAMETAAMKGQVEIAQALLNGGYDINRPTPKGSTYLHDAALANQKKMAELLLKSGASVHALNRTGGTPLHDAALGGSVDVINELLDSGAEIDAQDHDTGATPLMLAVSMVRIPATELLLRRGADVHVTDHTGRTALDRALATDDPNLIKLFKERSATRFHPAA